ncbi:MAG: hypothetical protein KBT12_05815 [Bacteroidales bacterium]|nr:hypothetical protein [Candidatus Physcousia equi]
MKIIYAHGFASAGSSGTATHLRNMLYEQGVQVLSPDLPTSPRLAMPFLHDYVEKEQPDLIVATSMGAFYAEQLRGYRRILVNPSFQMSRLLIFRGMGRHEFRNKRADGAKDFKVDKQMIAEFKEVEKNSFQYITPEEKELVWGLFGNNDRNVNCQPEFKKHYGTAHFQIFDGEHFLNDKVLKQAVLPVIKSLLSLA